MGEILLKGGTVIDGTGAPRREADVLVADGKIKAVAKGLSTTGETLDVSGLAVTPGLIDPHTHLDAQFFFEPSGTPLKWHGVTTVLMGNCGYSFAPVRPVQEHRDYLIKMFARAEEMDPQILEKHLPWDWESFGQYLGSLDKGGGEGLGVNAVTQVGHSTLRYYVMGAEAAERAATQDEIEKMCQVLSESIAAGSFGFSSSQSPTQVLPNNQPVPSRWAVPEEIVALAGALRKAKKGHMEFIPRGVTIGLTDEDKDTMLRMAEASGGKAVQINGAGFFQGREFFEDAATRGLTIYGNVHAWQPGGLFCLGDGALVFTKMDTWSKVYSMPAAERRAAYASPELRPILRQEVDEEAMTDENVTGFRRLDWNTIRVNRAAKPENHKYNGMSIPEIAKQQGKHLVDAMLDLALSDDLETEFSARLTPEAEWLSGSTRTMLSHPNVFPTSTDTGAHLVSQCNAGEGTYFLSTWVMKTKLMSIEEGVRRLTSQGAQWIGITDRGVIEEGKVADIAVFDLDKLAPLPRERAHDLPEGKWRWVQRAAGVVHVLVNGVPTIRDGKETGTLPGKVLRNQQYR